MPVVRRTRAPRTRPPFAPEWRRYAALALTSAILAAIGAFSVSRSTLRAQENPVLADGPTDRVFFLPEPGLSPAARAVLDGSAISVPAVDDAKLAWLNEENGIIAQNLGARPTRILALYQDLTIPQDEPCTHCGFQGARCSEPVAPGATAHLAPTWREGGGEANVDGPVTGLVATVYALNDEPAVAYGPGWAGLLDRAGLDGDTSVAEIVCGVFDGSVDLGWDGQCPSGAFLAAFTRAAPLPFAAGVDPAPLPGEPIGVVAAPAVEVGLSTAPAATLDRYRALGLAEIDAPLAAGALGTPPGLAASEGVWIYDLPGTVGSNPEEIASVARILHPGLAAGCATVRIEVFRTGGSSRGAITATLASGTWTTVDARRPEWSLTGTGNLRIVSNRPLATLLTTRGYGFSLSRPSLPAETRPRVQLAPLAYQALRPFDWAATSARDPGASRLAQATSAGARGWETNIAAFNPVPERRDLVLRLQGAGEPARDSGFPMEPRSQLVFQPGFGLGKPGGPGWAELSARSIEGDPSPIAAGIDAVRSATDVAFLLAGWGLPPWPRADAPDVPAGSNPAAGPARTIGLPTLGGPAVGDPSGATLDPPAMVVAADRFTTTLAARVAVQNPTTTTARVAIDTYARCGLAGTTELRLDPRQTAHLAVRDLEGIAFAPDAAIIRVLQGEVAAAVETQHVARASFEDAPLDMATAYRGAPSTLVVAPPAPPSATLAARPPMLRFDLVADPQPTPARVSIEGVAEGCVSWKAATVASWLALDTTSGALPGDLVVRVQPDALPARSPDRDTLQTTIQITTVPDAAGPPLRIPVTVVLPEPADPNVYLPLLQR